MLTPPQFVGIIAVNAAAIKPLFSASRWLISSKGSSKDKSSGYASKYGHPLGSMNASAIGQSLSSSRHQKMMTKLDENSSEEHIVSSTVEYHNNFKNDIRAGSTNSGQSGGDLGDGIMVTKTYEVSPAKSTLDV